MQAVSVIDRSLDILAPIHPRFSEKRVGGRRKTTPRRCIPMRACDPPDAAVACFPPCPLAREASPARPPLLLPLTAQIKYPHRG
uniref:Uncharacterized protein n=1 Tax=Oryza sativa subsp. japonica TaxID=39947 RepID=Q6Z575_ORYSJ|nr:hypothetical protein [Oryza sativa Japonica Group]BAC99685.1 hypothetical protein [Oryza sativa Japonica Group]